MSPDSKFSPEALTYDDVLLIPSYSGVLPKDTDISTSLSRNINLSTPLISAAMDTVTESKLAISMALEGGIGIIHKNMSIDQQAAEVRKVKRSQSGMILDPIILGIDASVGDAESIMREHKIGGIPIVNDENILIGIITNRDLRFEKEKHRPVKDIMTKDDLITATVEVGLAEAETILQQHRIEKLPIVNERNQLIGLITYRDILKNKDRPYACKDEYGRLRVGAAITTAIDTLERIVALQTAGVDVLCLDTAHGHSKSVISMAKKIKKEFQNIELIVGNIATGAAAAALAEAGADAIKVGVGPGSICTTRVIAGVGMPQLTAVYEAAKEVKSKNIPIIADGGIRFSGDVTKAIAAGASTVMIGSILAGTEEAPGEVILLEGRKFKVYRGMGSIEAMQEGSKDRYFQQEEENRGKLVPEGIVGRVPYKGKVQEVLYQLTGGLKAGMGYCGTKNINELQQAKFVKISRAGVIESHAHDIHITHEAPNYSRE